MKKGFKVAGLVVGVAGALVGAGAAVYGKYESLKKNAQVVAVDFIAEKNNLPSDALIDLSTEFQPKTQTFIVEVLNAMENKSHWVQVKLTLKKEVTHIVEFERNVPKKELQLPEDVEI